MDIDTVIHWAKVLTTEEKGTATLHSDTASWRQEGAHEAASPTSQYALVVRGFHVDDPSAGFNVEVVVTGSFRTDPPEIDGARFMIHQAHCGDGTSLDLQFRPYSENALERNGVWVVGFYCDGTFKIRHDVTVTFSGVMFVDTNGEVQLENPTITSDRSGHSQMHPAMSLHWDSNSLWSWEANFVAGNPAYMWVAFTFLKETFTTSETLG